MKRLLAVLIFTTASVCATTQQQIKNAQAITVLVTNEGFLGGGRGSGVLMDKTHVLTCAHMATSAKDELFVYTYPLGQVTKAHVQFVNTATDLALLLLDNPVAATKFAKFKEEYYDGEPITIIGNALGSMKWLVSRGVIAGTERDFLLTDVAINPGNSGGPWVDEDGNVLALTDWGIIAKRGPGVTGGISAHTINGVIYGWLTHPNVSTLFQLLEGKQ